ncbi:MAG TPA: histidine phosphatase family protein [Burkholderiales bacterium]|nr:histidine phosphatase family protein [Burkholderiales bacterium]
MDLILWRHADAEDGTPDAERKLTPKGEKQARRVADWLKEQLPDEYVVLVSPARRTRQTAQALTKDLELVEAVGTGASPKGVLQAAGWPDRNGVVIVVGHQPTLGQTVARALTGRDEGWSLRKGALWWLRSRDGEVSVRAVIGPDLL